MIEITDELLRVLNMLEQNDNYISYDLLYAIEYPTFYKNPKNIERIDVGKANHFKITIDDVQYDIKIGDLIKYFFKDLYSSMEIWDFIDSYNKVISGEKKGISKKIKVETFNYNPKDVRSTFLSLVTKTYPHGHEEEVLEFLPELDKDKFGNYYKIIGDNKQPQTMFTSHLDTADRKQMNTNLYSQEVNGDEIIYTDGTTILGSDDKSGVTIMLYMMENNVPGLYYFFIGEERGGIGSNKLSSEYDSFPYLKNIKRCISFDRRDTKSVITSQLGRSCCSNQFATALCKEYNSKGMEFSMDPNGIYTDSASFLDQIPECTNISVGYENEHTGRERQNITFLKKVAEASINVNWDSLPTHRNVILNNELVRKYSHFIKEIKRTYFGVDVKLAGTDDNKLFISIDLDEVDIDLAYTGLIKLQTMMKKYKLNDDSAIIDDVYLKIELK